MARRYWAGRDPIGGRFADRRRAERPWVTVVGIVADVRHNGITDVVKEKFYMPHRQWHEATGIPIRGMTLVVKASGRSVGAHRAVVKTIRALDANLPVADVRTMSEVVAPTVDAAVHGMLLVDLRRDLALVLSAIGIYGVLSYVSAAARARSGSAWRSAPAAAR